MVSGNRSKMKRRRVMGLLTLGLAAALLVWDGSRHRPTGPAFGTALEGRLPGLPAEQRSLRLATFNIHFGKGDDGQEDLARTAQCLQGLDLVALQEVRARAFPRRSDQARWLAEQLRTGWLFAPAVRRWYHACSGNAVLSRLPVRSWQRIPLPQVLDYSHRNAVLLVVEWPAPVRAPQAAPSVRVLLTHLTQRHVAEREVQFQAVSRLFLALSAPAVLMGDLNTRPDDPLMRELLGHEGVCDAVGEVLGPAAKPRVDWIITRGLKVTDAGVRQTEASDHPVVWAEVMLPEESAQSPPGTLPSKAAQSAGQAVGEEGQDGAREARLDFLRCR